MNCLQVITRAMRRIGVVSGDELPRTNEIEDAMATLRGIYRKLLSNGALGVLCDVTLGDGASYEASAGQRIIGRNADITVPETARHGSVICVVDPSRNQTDEFLFDANRQKWESIDDLTQTSPAPLAHADPNGLACALAVELADEYGQQPSVVTVQGASHFYIQIAHMFGVPDDATPGLYY